LRYDDDYSRYSRLVCSEALSFWTTYLLPVLVLLGCSEQLTHG